MLDRVVKVGYVSSVGRDLSIQGVIAIQAGASAAAAGLAASSLLTGLIAAGIAAAATTAAN